MFLTRMSKNNRHRDSASRRSVLKTTGIAVTGVLGLSGSAAACEDEGPPDKEYNWKKRVHFIGNENIVKDGICDYEFGIDADDWNGEIKRIDSYSEGDENVWNFTDSNGAAIAACGGEVKNGYRDAYEYAYDKSSGPWEYFSTTADMDVEIYDNMDTTGQWNIRANGGGEYTVYFAGDTEPMKGSNCDSSESTGTSSRGGYITGTVDSFDNPDDFWVYGDIKSIYVRNIGDSEKGYPSKFELKARSHHD